MFYLGLGLFDFSFRYIILPPLLSKTNGVSFSWHGKAKPTYHAQWLLFYSSYRAESPLFPSWPSWEIKEGRWRKAPLLLLVPRAKGRTFPLTSVSVGSGKQWQKKEDNIR